MNQTALSLLRLLSDGADHSLHSLANRLEISEKLVSGILNEQISSDIGLIASKDFGYCWKNPIQWLDKNAIRANQRDSHNIDIQLFDCIGSTNDYLIDSIKKNL